MAEPDILKGGRGEDSVSASSLFTHLSQMRITNYSRFILNTNSETKRRRGAPSAPPFKSATAHTSQTFNSVCLYRWPKKVSHCQMIKKSCYIVVKPVNDIRFIINLKYESSAIILFGCIRYSMCDLLSDLNNHAWPVNYWYASDTANYVSASSVINSH